MPRIDEMPEYRAKLGKSVHDLSHKFGFTATVGHLLPVFHDFLNPGETIQLGVGYNLRTQPLQSAAMIDLNAHVEYFFVPMPLLYEPFGSTYYNVQDLFSSNFPQSHKTQTLNLGNGDFPVIDFEDLLTQMQADDSLTIGYEDWMNHVYRLFDHFGFNNTALNAGTGLYENLNPNVFPWQIMAYHAVYQYYYRLDTRQTFDNQLFNWDRFWNTAKVDSTLIDYHQFFRLWYRPMASDYFTDVKVSPIVDSLNLYNSSIPAVNQWLTRSKNEVSADVVISGDSTGKYNGLLMNSDISSVIQSKFGLNTYASNVATIVSNDINTANIRAMFAAEKLWSITGRAGKHYDDQTLAHFGFNVPHDVKHEVSCFGHDQSKIHIGEVISTSNVSVDAQGSIAGSGGLGEIAGKGYGIMNTRVHKFTAPCHGVVLAIMSFAPDLTYGDTYLKCNSVANRNDFYTPEYDHLGMQPLFHYEGHISDGSNWSNIIGWQYRYEQWKRRFNRVSKAFQGDGNLDSWMLDIYSPTTVNSANTESYLRYTYSPSLLNQVMLVNYVNETQIDEAVAYDGDPFIIDSFISAKVVSTMSDYSLPRLDA